MTRSHTFVTVLLVAILVYSGLAQAHAPGLSRVELADRGGRLQAFMVFAAADIDAALSLDTNADGELSEREFTAARARIDAFARRALEIRAGGRIVPVESARAALSNSAAVDIALTFPGVTAATVGAPALVHLPRGHRQHVTVQDATGRVVARRMLVDGTAFELTFGVSDSRTGFVDYVAQGIWHILIGADHILFLLTLLLPAVFIYGRRRWQPVSTPAPAFMELGKCVTAFTAAHSITLTLAVFDVIVLPSRLVESTIAVSVIVLCANNLYPLFRASRWSLAFAFGLVHGFGFASVLIDLGLDAGALVVSLLGFNLGVEAGQLAIVALTFPLGYLCRRTRFYEAWVFRGGSLIAGAIAGMWLLERAFDVQLMRLAMPG